MNAPPLLGKWLLVSAVGFPRAVLFSGDSAANTAAFRSLQT